MQPAHHEGSESSPGDALGRIARQVPALPQPGRGSTADRFCALADWSADDLTIGRLAEAHYDALAILVEAGRSAPPAGTTYGVWATRSLRAPLRADPDGSGWRMTGQKAFCSGAELLDRALVTAEAPDGYRLFDVDLRGDGVSPQAGTWPAVGMAGSASVTVTFADVALEGAAAVGPPDFYLTRPGFWHGAVGVAACWSGGARGLVDTLIAGMSHDASSARLADLGRAVALVRAQHAVLARAAAAIDADPEDREGRAAYGAQAARQAIHDSSVEVLALVAAAGGARPLGHDGAQSRRAADLYVYLSQHHGGDDAAALGRAALTEAPWR